MKHIEAVVIVVVAIVITVAAIGLLAVGVLVERRRVEVVQCECLVSDMINIKLRLEKLEANQDKCKWMERAVRP